MDEGYGNRTLSHILTQAWTELTSRRGQDTEMKQYINEIITLINLFDTFISFLCSAFLLEHIILNPHNFII